MLPFHERLARIGLEALQGKKPAEFEAYEVGTHWRSEIIARFLDWADEIDPVVAR